MIEQRIKIDLWIEKHIKNIRCSLLAKSKIDEDAFQDAYLSLATGSSPICGDNATFEKAFLALYRKFSYKNISDTFATAHPDELFFSLLPSEDTDPMEDAPEEPSTEKIVAKIQRHIRATFPRRDVRILELRLLGFSCRDITDAFGIGTTAINNTTNRIITQTRREFAAVAF